MGLRWVSHGSSMDARGLTGTVLGYPWASHGSLKWASHDSPMGLIWVSRGSPVDLPCYPMGAPCFVLKKSRGRPMDYETSSKV